MRKGRSFHSWQKGKPLKAEPCSVQNAARQLSGRAASDPPTQEEGREVCL